MKRMYVLGLGAGTVSVVLFAWSLAAVRSQSEGDRDLAKRTAAELKSSQPAEATQSRVAAAVSDPVRSTGNQVATPAHPAANYLLEWQVISSGGGLQTSASYEMNSTVGETVTGESSSASYNVGAGFWNVVSVDVGPVCCLGTTGNTDGSPDDVVDISDVFAVVDYLGASLPLSNCMEENDVNIDGTIDISDLFALIDYLSGTAPLRACP